MAKPRSIDELMTAYRAELTRRFFFPTGPRSSAECGNVSFVGADAFSYGEPILRLIRIEDAKQPLLAITATPYSITSSRHTNLARAAAGKALNPYIRWTTPMPDCSTTSRYAPEDLLERVGIALRQMQSTRTHRATKIGALVSFDHYLDDYTLFVEHAGMHTNDQLTALQQARKTNTESEYILHARALAALNA